MSQFANLLSFSLFSSSKLSSFSIFVSKKICKHSENAFFIFEFVFDFLSFSSAFCDHVFEDHFMTQDFTTLYNMHLNENAKVLRCNWYVQIKKTQEIYHLRKHEMKMKSKIKQKAKKLLKQQQEIRLIKKEIEKYTCKRCKTTKFDNNIKFHEHIRTRHAKKSKTIVSFFAQVSESSVSSFQSIISSSSTSSKLVIKSSTIFSKFSSKSLSIETSRKSIFWAEIISRSITALKFSRLSIATLKLMCKSLKNASIACSLTSSRIFTSSRFYFFVNDLFRMFVEKSNSFDLRRSQMRLFFSKIVDKCNFKSNDFIRICITLYFNATILFAFKSIKFETFASTHVRENVSRQFSRSISFISFSFRFSMIFRSISVCKQCQKRYVIYWFFSWIMSIISRVENKKIFMRVHALTIRRFARSRFTLKKYWFLLEKVITLRELKHVFCLFVLFVSFSLLLNLVILWESIDLKELKVVLVFNVSSLSSLFDLRKLKVICFIVLFH